MDKGRYWTENLLEAPKPPSAHCLEVRRPWVYGRITQNPDTSYSIPKGGCLV